MTAIRTCTECSTAPGGMTRDGWLCRGCADKIARDVPALSLAPTPAPEWKPAVGPLRRVVAGPRLAAQVIAQVRDRFAALDARPKPTGPGIHLSLTGVLTVCVHRVVGTVAAKTIVYVAGKPLDLTAITCERCLEPGRIQKVRRIVEADLVQREEVPRG